MDFLRHCPCAAAVSLALAAQPALAADWTYAAVGDWFNTANWSTGAVPVTPQVVQINQGTPQILVNPASAGDLFVAINATGVTLQLAFGGRLLTTGNTMLGFDAGSIGQIRVEGVGVSWRSFLNVTAGESGAGIINILGGSRVDVDGTVGLGVNAGSSGALTVSGAGSTLNIADFLSSGTGSTNFSVVDGGTVNVGRAFGVDNGTLEVRGVNSRLHAAAGISIAPFGFSAATVNQGGVLSTGGNVIVGDFAAGLLTVSGAGSSVTSNAIPGSVFTIGRNDFGTLLVNNGGVVSVPSSYLILGDTSSATGTATIDGVGSQITALALIAGRDGFGSFALNNGAQAQTGTAFIGGAAFLSGGIVVGGGTGVVSVSGSGSRWLNATALEVGAGLSAVGGTGSLTISAGGTVDTGILVVGSAPLGSGSVAITGAGSALRVSSGIVADVGRQGTAVLTVADGGLLESGGGMGAVTLARFGGSGTLNIGNGGAAGVLNAAAVNGGAGSATLNFNHNQPAYAFENLAGTGVAIAGSTVVNHSGGGGTIFTANNSYFGLTTINAGTLQIGNGSVSGTLGTGAVVNNGALVFNRSDTLAVKNAVSGTGSLTQAGSGTLNLTGVNSYSGPTQVNAGTLLVNGSIANSAVTVAGGATLGGNGTAGATTVLAGGVLAPGNSIGTLTVNGSLSFAPGSVFRVETDAAGNADRINVIGAPGTATIGGGTVDVQAGAGVYRRNATYTILNATGGVTGTFNGVTSNLAFLTPTLSYDANNVLLNLASSDVLTYNSAALTSTQTTVANMLTPLIQNPGNAQAAALTAAIDNLSAPQGRLAFESLSGMAYPAGSQIALTASRSLGAALMRRASDAGSAPLGARNAAPYRFDGLRLASLDTVAWADSPRTLADGDAQSLHFAGVGGGMQSQRAPGLWMQALTGGGRFGSDGNGVGSDHRTRGGILGVDHLLESRSDTQWLLGMSVAFARTAWDAAASPTAGGLDMASGAIHTPSLHGYARYDTPAWRLSLAAGVDAHRFQTTRQIAVGGVGGAVTSRYRAYETSIAAQLETSVDLGASQLRPSAGIRYARLAEPDFTESGNVGGGIGSGANLNVAARTTQSANLSLGGTWAKSFTGGSMVELKAFYSRLFGDNDTPISARFIDQAVSFSVKGTPLKRDALTVGAGLFARLDKRFSAFANLGYEYRGSSQSSYAVMGGMRYEWL